MNLISRLLQAFSNHVRRLEMGRHGIAIIIISTAGAIKYIKLTSGTNTVIVVGNFDVVNQTANIDFGTTGTWINATGGSNINLGNTTFAATLAPGEYHIYSKQALN